MLVATMDDKGKVCRLSQEATQYGGKRVVEVRHAQAHSFIHSFNKYSLPFCSAPRTELSAENTPGKTRKLSSLNFQFNRGDLLLLNYFFAVNALKENC